MEQLLNSAQVAKLLNLRSRKTVDQWRREGKLTAIVFSPKVIRYRPEDIEDFKKASLQKGWM